MASKLGRRIYSSRRWRALRVRIIKRDRYRCQTCQRVGGRLEVHHLKRVTKSNPQDWWNPEVLRTICRSCHIGLSRAEQTKPRSPERQKFMEMANA